MTLASLLPRFRRAREELTGLAARERWPRARIAAFQLERLNALWSQAVSHVPYYRQLRESRGLPSGFATLDEFRALVPLLPKQAVRDAPDAFLSDAAGRGAWRMTSGSSGIPMRIYWTGEAHRDVLRCRYRFLQSWGVDLLDRSTFVMGPATAARGILARAGWQARARLRNRQWLFVPRLGRGEIERALARVARFQPVLLYGYSTTIRQLALEARARGVRWDALRLVVLTSEPSPPPLRDEVTRAFDVPVITEYGATECEMIAAEQPDGSLQVREDIVIVETLPAADGWWELVVTVLANPAFPLIRYRIGDLVRAPLREPDTGFAATAAVYGRDDDFLVAPDGTRIDSTAVEHLVQGVSGVRAFRVSQERDGMVTLTVECRDTPAAQLERLRRHLGGLVDGYPVTLRQVDALPLSGAGKHRVVTSELMSARA